MTINVEIQTKYHIPIMDTTDLDIVDVLNAVLPFEKHFPGTHYLGPGTRLNLRLDENRNPFPGSEPVNRVDEAALKHDKAAYSRHDDLRSRPKADKEMLFDLYSIKNSTRREPMERCLAVPILLLKRFFGTIILGLMDVFALLRMLIGSLVLKMFCRGE